MEEKCAECRDCGCEICEKLVPIAYTPLSDVSTELKSVPDTQVFFVFGVPVAAKVKNKHYLIDHYLPKKVYGIAVEWLGEQEYVRKEYTFFRLIVEYQEYWENCRVHPIPSFH